ncbi:hypothetical protein [Planctomicrobium sp. SH527]|uniref:hypothetical protein n=1 Tax=Planctomicrobium sp. SH527 TaxID=3448123 RepID=UPI003F5C3A08
MSAHFAGSIGSADRRRRRMAQESPVELSPAIKERSVRVPRKPESAAEEDAAPVARRRRLTLIPHAWWLINILAAANVLAWGFLIWTGTTNWSENANLQELANLKSGASVRYFSVLQLLLTAQLSLLIYWYRSMSRKDFMGRYRIWGWAGLFWAAVCLATATNTNFSDIRSLLTRMHLDAWRPDVTCWLLPLSIGVVAIYRVLRREVRQSRPSLIAWEISFALGIFAASLHLGLDSLIPKPARLAVTTAAGTLWQVSLVISCLIHARFVVHISNESPPRHPSRGTMAIRWANRRINRVGERILATQLPVRLKRKQENDQSVTATDPQSGSSAAKKRKSVAAKSGQDSSETSNDNSTENSSGGRTWKLLPSRASLAAFKVAVLSKFKRSGVADADGLTTQSSSSTSALSSVSRPDLNETVEAGGVPQKTRTWSLSPTKAFGRAKSALTSRFKRADHATNDDNAPATETPKSETSETPESSKRRIFPSGWSFSGIKSGLQSRLTKKERPSDPQATAATSSPVAKAAPVAKPAIDSGKPETPVGEKKSLWDRLKRNKQTETAAEAPVTKPIPPKPTPVADKAESSDTEKKSGWGWPKRNKQTETTSEAPAKAPAAKPAPPKPAPAAEKSDSSDAEKKSGWGWPKRNKQKETTAEAPAKAPAAKPAPSKPAPVAEKSDSSDTEKKSGWGWPKRNKQTETTAEVPAKPPATPATPQEKEPRKSLLPAGSSWMKSKSNEGESLRADPPVEPSQKVPTPHVAPANSPTKPLEPVKPVVQAVAQPVVQAAAPFMEYEVHEPAPIEDSHDDRGKRSKDKRAKQKNRSTQGEFGDSEESYGEDDEYGQGNSRNQGGRNKNKKQKKQRHDDYE